MNFLELLIEKHRMPVALPHPRASSTRCGSEENKLLPVEITSRGRARRSDRQAASATGSREQTGRKVELSRSVEPDILGGIVLRVGNSILDASIRNRLEQLRKQVARKAA